MTARSSPAEAIFHGALERDPSERSAYLDHACAGDTPLRKEVDALLTGYSEGMKHLEKGVPSSILAGLSPDSFVLHAAGESPGGKPSTPLGMFGAYELLEILGQGGQGVVYLARDTRLDRRVALKVISSFTLGGSGLERFEREARVASRLDHPGICTIYEAGQVDGRAFIAMQFVEGEPLSAAIRRSGDAGESCVALPGATDGSGSRIAAGDSTQARERLRSVVGFFEGAARALHAAHEAGLIHRDIKPGNIMVSPEGKPILFDFGLARDADNTHEPITQPGDLLGTPQYMSLEQVDGQPLDRTTDIYSLGVSLYESLTLKRLYTGKTRAAVYDGIRRGKLTKPRVHNRVIASDLAVILETAIDADPTRRYQTAREFAEDLRAFLEFRPIRARRAGPLRRLRRWSQRRPLLALAAVVVVLGCAVGAVVTPTLLERREEGNRLKSQGLLSESREAAAQGLFARSFLLARAAVQKDQNPNTVAWLHTALSCWHPHVTMRAAGNVMWAEFSPDETRVLTASAGKNLAQLWDASSGELIQEFAHKETVHTAVFAPDGKRVLTSSRDGTACIWSIDGRLVRKLQHGWPVRTAFYSTVGDLILTASADRTARLWDRDGKPLQELIHKNGVGCAVFSRDGKLLATGSWDGVARIWKRSKDRWLGPMELTGHGNGIQYLEFSPDGKRLLTATTLHGFTQEKMTDYTVRVWNTRSGVCERVLDPRGRTWTSVFMDNRHVLTSSKQGGVVSWDVDRGFEKALHGKATDSLWGARFSPAAGLIAVGTVRDAGSMALLLTRTGIPVAELRGHSSHVQEGVFSKRGERLLTRSKDETARVWPLFASELPLLPVGKHDRPSATYSPAGDRYLTAGDGVLVRDTVGRIVSVLEPPGPPGSAYRLARYADKDRVVAYHVTKDGERSLKIWDKGKKPRVFVIGTEPLGAVAIAPGGGYAVTASGKVARVWRIAQRAEKKGDRYRHDTAITSVDITPGRDVVLGGDDGTIRVFRSGARPPSSFASGEKPIRSVRFSRDGDLLLIASNDGVARLHRPDGGLIREFRGHEAAVLSAEFSQDGSRIVTASEDRTARVWDLEGHQACIYRGHEDAVVGAVFSPTGEHVLTVSSDGTARTWFVRVEDLLEYADRAPWRGFTGKEQEKYRHLLEN